ncbi:hypothetical protein SLEP1_g9981 [Rubroshorea leprosula]|uniref:Uncharacterized protein n=1 Tax=Rubroshorea leprosula TaxID=152421 RepID=A0AAV5I6M5_9ROSI|nr:hypothetical protein SLEP1_g9981 [Rubroshorea leprosula]
MPSIPLPPFYDSTLTLPSAYLLPPFIFSFAPAGPFQIPFPPLHYWSAAAKLLKPSTCYCQTVEAIYLLLSRLSKPYVVMLRSCPSWY